MSFGGGLLSSSHVLTRLFHTFCLGMQFRIADHKF
uniref:Uncharacterized protein n=1 Tax=Arundo donax TaxID=35708 RepID=A0A0A9DP79_ARUDO